MDCIIGNFAKAKAGHDLEKVYVIVGQEKGYIDLCDGNLRKIDNPKKKNRKHIQIINQKVESNLLNRLYNKDIVFDHEIKYSIKQYLKQEEVYVEK